MASVVTVLFVLYGVLVQMFSPSPHIPEMQVLHATTGATVVGFSRSQTTLDLPRRDAMFWTSLADGEVQCNLCPHECVLAPGETGICLARMNDNGRLRTLTYGHTAVRLGELGAYNNPVSFAGFKDRMSLVIGLVGCQLRCAFCYLGETALMDPRELVTMDVTPESVVELAVQRGNLPIIFSYNEPTNNFEFTLDVLRLAKENGLVTILSSSGYVNPEPARTLAPYTDAMALGLKAFTEEGYRRLTTGSLAPVLRATEIFYDAGTKIEIHYLLVSGITDSREELESLAHWVRDRLGNYPAIHIIPFKPTYKLASLPPTPLSAVATAINVLRQAGAIHVFPYMSVYQDRPEGTTRTELLPVRCGHCGAPIWDIKLVDGRPVAWTSLVAGHCGTCGKTLPGIPEVLDREPAR